MIPLLGQSFRSLGGGGGGGSVPQARALGYLGDTPYALDAPNSIVSSISDQGGGVTRIVLDAANSGNGNLPHQGDAYFFDAYDTDGDLVSGQHHAYDIMLGLEATAVGGGVIDEDVQVALLLINGSVSRTLNSANDEGFGPGLVGISGGLAGVLNLAERAGWNRSAPQTTIKGDASTRVAYGSPKPAANSNGITGYDGSWSVSAAGFDSPQQRLAEFNAEEGGALLSDDYNTLALVVNWAGTQATDRTVDVRAWFRAIKRTSTTHGMPAQGFGS